MRGVASRSEGRRYPRKMVSVRPWALAAGAFGLVTLGIYIAALVNEGNNTISEVAPWLAAMIVASALALVGAKASDRTVARRMLLAAAILFGVLGMLAIFSVGILFLAASAMSAVAHVRVNGKESAPIG